MRSRWPFFSIAALTPLLAAALASCSSGGGLHQAAVVPAATSSSPAQAASVTLVLRLPARTSSSVRRLPKYISSATLGASITVTVAAVPLTTTFSLAPNSSSCVTSNGTTTCTLTAAAPKPGAATVTVNLYDQAPVANVLPNTAALLSSGTVGATIAEGTANVTLPVILSGVVEGAAGGSATTLTSGGTVAQASFIAQVTDADANVILASNGAVTRTGSAVALTLSVPASIAGVTLLNFTQNPNGSPAQSITNVNPGDRIVISSSASTPTVIGVPVNIAIGTTPIGVARVPSNGSGAPSAVPTSYPGNVDEIDAVPPWSSLDSSTTGGGFVMLTSSSNQALTGFIVNPSTHVPVLQFQCAVPASFIVDHVATAAYPYLALAEHTTSDVTLNTFTESGGTCATGTQAFSALAQYGAGPAIASWTESASDGAAIGGALVLSSSGNGQNAIVTAPNNGSASGGGNAIGNASNQANIAALRMSYTKATALAVGFNQLAYRNPTNLVQTTALSNGAPSSAALDGAGNIYILYQDGPGTVQKCSLGSTVTCTYAGALAAYNPSYDHRAMALGPDNKLYVASGSGVIVFDPTQNTSFNTGSTGYKQAAASGDGHIYLLRANGSGVDAYP